MTVHLVTEELRARGWKVEHIHIWDDFDRLRKVPNGHTATLARKREGKGTALAGREDDICMICASFKMITTGYAAAGCVARSNHLAGSAAGAEESSKTKFAGL